MKELEKHLQLDTKERIELNVKQKKEIEYVLQGTLKPKIGHFIWEINEKTLEIKKAEFKRTTAVFGSTIPPKEMILKADYVYIPALNAKNALKKYHFNKNQTAYYSKPPIMNL